MIYYQYYNKCPQNWFMKSFQKLYSNFYNKKKCHLFREYVISNVGNAYGLSYCWSHFLKKTKVIQECFYNLILVDSVEIPIVIYSKIIGKFLIYTIHTLKNTIKKILFILPKIPEKLEKTSNSYASWK